MKCPHCTTSAHFDYIFVKPKQRKLFLENINKKYGINTDE